MTSDIIKQNFELKKENARLNQENKELKNENQKLRAEVKRVSNIVTCANNRINFLEKQIEEYKKNEEERIAEIVSKTVNAVVEKLNKEHQEEVEKLNAKIKRLESRLNIDSTNSSTPTSKEPIGKHTIQNNREKSSKSKGAQPNHKQHKLEYFKEEEITNKVEHKLDKCPNCNGELTEMNIVISDIIDVEIIVTKTRNLIHNYKCNCCHKNVTANEKLPRGVTYGDNVNSIALSMMNESNTALNKVSSFFSGITDKEINLSEGYLIKLQKRCANKLNTFVNELANHIITLPRLFWDDTVCKFGSEKPEEGYDDKDLEYLSKNADKTNKNRQGIIRFYGDDNWALLVGHRNKDEKSVDNDGILELLPASCVVMHDHLLLNYNDKYNFRNAECNEHTKRYLKKNMDIFPEHDWAKEMRDLLINTNKRKKELIDKEITSFTQNELEEISSSYDKIIEKGYLENNKVNLTYIKDKNDELNLIERLETFKENHLLFAYDFTVEFTNNTSEKGLRQVKRKLAVAFMFKNANRMKDYATILSYLETCYRNGITRYDASKRLVQNNPYTVSEIKAIIKEKESEKN